MLWRLRLRDIKRRERITPKAFGSNHLRFLLGQKTITQKERAMVSFKLYRKNRIDYRVQAKNRCLLSFRGQFVYRMFRLSRIRVKELCGCGWLPGLRKSTW